jgi:hypothetical protein
MLQPSARANSFVARRNTDTTNTVASDPPGATMATDYAHQSQLVTVIDVEDLKEFQSSMREEFWQFALGGFLSSGAFWLFVERLFTVPHPAQDILLWLCVFAFIAGAAIAFFGYRQLTRRKGKIQRIIDAAEASAKARIAAATAATAPQAVGGSTL